MKFLKLLLLILCFQQIHGQGKLTSIDGWNAYVHLPASYDLNPTKNYATIIFYPGLGEVGNVASAVVANGPGAYLAQGWNGNVTVAGNLVEFIVISLQPSAAYPTETVMNAKIQKIKSLYRVNPNKLYLTGLSHGGWCGTTFVTGDAYGGPYNYASQVAAVVEVQGVIPDDNGPYPNLWDNYAKAGGRLLGFEQKNDNRGMPTRVNRMNAAKPGSAIYVQTNFGGGGHCCWNQFYGGQGALPGYFMLDGVSQNLYEWLARQGKTDTVPPAPAGPCNTAAPKTFVLTGTGSNQDEIYRPKGAWKGGDTIKLSGNNFSVIEFNDLAGDPCRDIVIMPLTTATTKALRIKNNCRHVTVWGGPTPYGLKVDKNPITVSKSHHITVDNVQASGGSTGVFAKQDVEYADTTTWGKNYTMTKLIFRNLKIYGILGEGMYVGITQSDGLKVKSTWSGKDTTILPIKLDSVEIYNCIVDSTTWDGIQLATSISGNKIYNNKITRYGLLNLSSQQNGIVLGGQTPGTIKGNEISNGTGAAIAIFGQGLVTCDSNSIYNVTSPGQDAIYIGQRGDSSGLKKLQVNATGNIIDRVPRNGIRNDGAAFNSLPGTWKYNVITNTGAAKYVSTVGDKIIEAAAPTMLVSVHDSLMALEAAKQLQLSNRITELENKVKELQQQVNQCEAIKTETLNLANKIVTLNR